MEGGVRRKRAVCWLPNEQVEGWSVSINVSIGRVSLFGNKRESYLVLDNNRGTCLKPARHKSEEKKGDAYQGKGGKGGRPEYHWHWER